MSDSAHDHEGGNSLLELKLPKKAALLCTIGACLLGLIFLYYETYSMMPPILPGYPGDSFFPRMVLVFTILFAVIILVRGLFLPQEAAAVGTELPYFVVHWLEFVSVIVLVFLYANLMEPLGFEIATFLFLAILLVPRLDMPVVKALAVGSVVSLTTMLILYAAFGLFLKIHLPLRFVPLYIQ